MKSYQKDLDAFYDKINVDYATFIAGKLSSFGSNEELGYLCTWTRRSIA